MPIAQSVQPAAERSDLPSDMQQGDPRRAGFSLLFPAGARPGVDDIVRLLASGESGIAARISHCPPASEGWLEILVNGLIFDLRGLSPAIPSGIEAAPYAYGFAQDVPTGLEPVELVPAGHIAAGGALPPVVRALAGLAANLAQHLPVQAVVWHPAQTLMEQRYFSRIVFNWLSGGAFPALGLTALVPAEDGSVASKGLAHFTGREMQLEGRAGEPLAESVKLAIRLVDYFMRHGIPNTSCTIEDVNGPLFAEPSQTGKRVWVWRKEA